MKCIVLKPSHIQGFLCNFKIERVISISLHKKWTWTPCTFKTPNSNVVHPVLYSKLKYVSTWVGSIPLMFSPFLIHNVVLNIHGAHFNKPTVRNGLNYHKRNTTGSLQVVLTSFTTLHTIL